VGDCRGSPPAPAVERRHHCASATPGSRLRLAV